MFFLSGQCILKKGDMGNAVSINIIYGFYTIQHTLLQMYFISKGEVEVVSGKYDSIRITQIGAGNFFGEISCFLGCLITATIK